MDCLKNLHAAILENFKSDTRIILDYEKCHKNLQEKEKHVHDIIENYNNKSIYVNGKWFDFNGKSRLDVIIKRLYKRGNVQSTTYDGCGSTML